MEVVEAWAADTSAVLWVVVASVAAWGEPTPPALTHRERASTAPRAVLALLVGALAHRTGPQVKLH